MVFVSWVSPRRRDFMQGDVENYRRRPQRGENGLAKGACARTLSAINSNSLPHPSPFTNILSAPDDRRSTEACIQPTPRRSPRAVLPKRQPPTVRVPRQLRRQVHQVLNHAPQPPAKNLLPLRCPIRRRQPPLFLQPLLAAQSQPQRPAEELTVAA